MRSSVPVAAVPTPSRPNGRRRGPLAAITVLALLLVPGGAMLPSVRGVSSTSVRSPAAPEDAPPAVLEATAEGLETCGDLIRHVPSPPPGSAPATPPGTPPSLRSGANSANLPSGSGKGVHRLGQLPRPPPAPTAVS